MRYNEDSYRYVYDRNQILSLADTGSISAQKRQQTIDYFKNRQTDVKVTSPLMTIVLVMGLIAPFLVAMLLLVRAIKRHDPTPGVLSLSLFLFVYAVHLFLVMGDKQRERKPDRLPGILNAFMLIALGITLPVLFFGVLPYEDEGQSMYFVLGTFLSGIGAILFINVLLVLTEKIRIYRNKTEGRCIGYVRTIVKEQRNGLFSSIVYTSPLFELDINGEKFAAFYDHLTEGRNSSTAIGETVTLHVSSKDPGYIMAPVCRRVIWKFAGAAVLIAIGVFLIISVLNGHVEGSALHW